MKYQNEYDDFLRRKCKTLKVAMDAEKCINIIEHKMNNSLDNIEMPICTSILIDIMLGQRLDYIVKVWRLVYFFKLYLHHQIVGSPCIHMDKDKEINRFYHVYIDKLSNIIIKNPAELYEYVKKRYDGYDQTKVAVQDCDMVRLLIYLVYHGLSLSEILSLKMDAIQFRSDRIVIYLTERKIHIKNEDIVVDLRHILMTRYFCTVNKSTITYVEINNNYAFNSRFRIKDAENYTMDQLISSIKFGDLINYKDLMEIQDYGDMYRSVVNKKYNYVEDFAIDSVQDYIKYVGIIDRGVDRERLEKSTTKAIYYFTIYKAIENNEKNTK